MLALTSAGYCAYRWLKRSSDLQAAELQAAHGVSSDEIRLDQSPVVVKRPGETVKISCVSSDEIRLDQSPAVMDRPGPGLRRRDARAHLRGILRVSLAEEEQRSSSC
ncbi:hypothetical protein KOW79_001871 [Hemibagrus wyckioides]|uniref:Uncharacterized protein n=1 Tax=Hemibagrus wyckioides TaxID=337641 RepID=A0A9D3P5T2_9TELE|nr:hypothetical protein KOW79_001871 [Hemibagrus wyckioides]